jgi:putative membrane protein
MMNLIATAVPAADVDWGHMGDWGAASWLAMVAFWALIIVLLVWVVREFATPSRDEGAVSATELLERRLAAGEISVEEYQARISALRGEARTSSDSG